MDVEIRGRRIPAGALVSEMIGAANRDPDQFADPDRLDIRDRGPGLAHLGFGVGIHFCVGAALARLEAAIAIPTILGRFPGLSIAEGGAAWRANTTFRGLSRRRTAVRRWLNRLAAIRHGRPDRMTRSRRTSALLTMRSTIQPDGDRWMSGRTCLGPTDERAGQEDQG